MNKSNLLWIETHLNNLAAVSDASAAKFPNSFQLNQNYPNPFNAHTTISFSLAEAGFVTLKIFNLAGAELATLVADKLPAGVHQFQWHANQVASGVYVYRLEVDGAGENRKLVLLK
ncbi:T9SS type A sorting domain-containing protein [candidate division KSB1 bacterium]|nr:T9SS type A sorting domain-containing protein [candidate division KSB1 bacterium]